MNVLHLISSSGFYGAERVVVELSKELLRNGGKPVIAVLVGEPASSRDMSREAEANGIKTRIYHSDAMLSPAVVRDLERLIREEGIEVVHSHGYKSNFYALWATRRRLPLVATNHNWLKHHWRLVAYSRIDKRLIRLFDRIVAVSEAIRSEMIDAGIPAGRITVIDNGVDAERIVKETGSLCDGKGSSGARKRGTIGAIGSLKEEKGFRYLVDAMVRVVREMPGVQLLIAGDGPLRKALEHQIASCNAGGYILLTGYRSDVYKMLGTLDLFVLPSLNEGLPMVLLEAMAAGIPVVATRVGAVPRVVSDGANGLLVAPGNPVALSEAIVKLLGAPTLSAALAARGRETVKERFSSESMFRSYRRVYREALEGR